MGVIKRLADAGRALFGKTTPAQRAGAAGLIPGHPIADHYQEGNKVTNWNYVAQHAVAKEAMQATVTVKIKQRKQQTITKSAAQDSPDEQATSNEDHPISKLFDSPNALTSKQEFLYQYEMQLRTTGGVVIWDVRNQDGMPVEMYILPMAWLSYQIPTTDYPLGLWKVYSPRGMYNYFRNNNLANGFMIDVRETFIPKYSHPLYPGEPLSPLTQCAQIIDIAEKSEEAVVAALQNSIRPSMIISLVGDPPQSVMDETLARLKERKAGAHNTGEALVVGSETKTEIISTRMAELDAVNVRKQNQDFNFQVQGTPSIATGGDNSGTYSGNAATINTHVELSLQPDLDLLAGKGKARWETLYPGLEIEINAKRMNDPELQGQRAARISAMAEKGQATINEARAAENLPPMEGCNVLKQPQPPTPPGMPGAPGDPGADADPLALPDLEDDEPTDTTTGVVDQSRIGMPQQKRLVWLNGYREGH
jgi:phage portal protein BeeE